MCDEFLRDYCDQNQGLWDDVTCSCQKYTDVDADGYPLDTFVGTPEYYELISKIFGGVTLVTHTSIAAMYTFLSNEAWGWWEWVDDPSCYEDPYYAEATDVWYQTRSISRSPKGAEPNGDSTIMHYHDEVEGCDYYWDDYYWYDCYWHHGEWHCDYNYGGWYWHEPVRLHWHAAALATASVWFYISTMWSLAEFVPSAFVSLIWGLTIEYAWVPLSACTALLVESAMADDGYNLAIAYASLFVNSLSTVLMWMFREELTTLLLMRREYQVNASSWYRPEEPPQAIEQFVSNYGA